MSSEGTRLVLAGRSALALKTAVALLAASAAVNFAVMAARPYMDIDAGCLAALNLGCIVAAVAGIMLTGYALRTAKCMPESNGKASEPSERESR